MSLANIPSYSSLIPRDKTIKAILDLYDAFIEFTASSGYIKPEDGIPASDMTVDVQQALAKIGNLLITNYNAGNEAIIFDPACENVAYDENEESIDITF